ncbi:MAG: UvrB/UvrC motif-containing protein [Owenweeksia sp.]|nr:UvrB/UvrC motif-containing protein [Owenweeksia sp.]
MDQLHQLLDKAVNSEDYELAARVRDEIDKRSAN